MVVFTADALTLQCDYNIIANNSYECQSKNVNIKYETAITSITGDHQCGKSRSDVDFLHIIKQPCYFLPTGIENFFPNLKRLRLQDTGLMLLRQTDLKPLKNLAILDLPGNSLQVLDSNLFASNPNLEYIYLGYNIIKLVGLGILDPLDSTRVRVYFNKNVCIDAAGNVETLKRELELKCQPECQARCQPTKPADC